MVAKPPLSSWPLWLAPQRRRVFRMWSGGLGSIQAHHHARDVSPSSRLSSRVSVRVRRVARDCDVFGSGDTHPLSLGSREALLSPTDPGGQRPRCCWRSSGVLGWTESADAWFCAVITDRSPDLKAGKPLGCALAPDGLRQSSSLEIREELQAAAADVPNSCGIKSRRSGGQRDEGMKLTKRGQTGFRRLSPELGRQRVERMTRHGQIDAAVPVLRVTSAKPMAVCDVCCTPMQLARPTIGALPSGARWCGADDPEGSYRRG
jgi:hypothetical protein